MLSALLLAAALSGAPGQGCYNLRSDARWDVMDDRTILVSAGLHAYRITVTPNPVLTDPSVNLIVERAGVVCSPIELKLSAAGPGVGRNGLIVNAITELSREQAEDLRHGQPKSSFLRR